MAAPQGGRVDLLAEGRRERALAAQEGRPQEPAWRADALGQSRHSRLDGLRFPMEGSGAAAAASLCASLCRQALGDFAPALLLLPRAERERVQPLAAHALTLFDFARQRGVEGEKLSQINRWEFALEEALRGTDAEAVAVREQPIFRQMAAVNARRPWPGEALATLAAAARARAIEPASATAEETVERERALARALVHAALGELPPAPLIELGAVLLALAPLQDVGEELRQRRWPVPLSDIPCPALPGEPPSPPDLEAALRRAQARLRGRLAEVSPRLAALPQPWRRPARYLARAAHLLLNRMAVAEPGRLEAPFHLGILSRLCLLVPARRG